MCFVRGGRIQICLVKQREETKRGKKACWFGRRRRSHAVYRALVGLLPRVDPHVDEQLVSSVEGLVVARATRPIAGEVLGLPLLHMDLLDVPHQLLLVLAHDAAVQPTAAERPIVVWFCPFLLQHGNVRQETQRRVRVAFGQVNVPVGVVGWRGSLWGRHLLDGSQWGWLGWQVRWKVRGWGRISWFKVIGKTLLLHHHVGHLALQTSALL